MNTIKHRTVAAVGAAALTLTFASACGTEVATAPAEIGVEQEAPAPPQPRFQSPDSIDRPENPGPTAGQAPCVFSADAAERLDRQPCVG